MSCCGFPWAGGGGGGGYFPLTANRVVVTDAAGLPAVGPYWDSATQTWGLAGAPLVGTDLSVARARAGGIVEIRCYNDTPFAASTARIVAATRANTGNSSAMFVASDPTISWSWGIYAPTDNCVFVYGFDFSVGGNYYMQFSRQTAERQVSFFSAVPTSGIPFNVESSHAAGDEHVYRFDFRGGVDGVFLFEVENLGIATMRVLSGDNSVFELRTTNAVLQLLNDDSGISQIISTIGLILHVNANGINGGYANFTSDVTDPDKIWVQNDCVTWRSAYYDADLWPALVGQEGYGDMWFQELAGVRTVQFRLHRGGVDYTASITLV